MDADSESDSEVSSSEEAIRKELSEIPLGELQEIQQKLGTKRFDVILRKAVEERDGHSAERFKKAKRHRPREMTSKRPVSRFRQVIPVQKHEIRDPRFDERTGKLNKDLFKKSYSFLDDMKEKEKTMVRKEAKKARNPVKKAKLQRLLQQMDSCEAAEKREEERRALLREHRKAERELLSQGKKPFYIKKSMQKRIGLAEKYKQLQKSGKLDKFLSKKRKKNASRDRKQMPFKRK